MSQDVTSRLHPRPGPPWVTFSPCLRSTRSERVGLLWSCPQLWSRVYARCRAGGPCDLPPVGPAFIVRARRGYSRTPVLAGAAGWRSRRGSAAARPRPRGSGLRHSVNGGPKAVQRGGVNQGHWRHGGTRPGRPPIGGRPSLRLAALVVVSAEVV